MLEKLMYVVQEEKGIFFADDDPRRNQATEKLYFECVDVLASYYGYYYPWKKWERTSAIEQQSKLMAPLEEKLRKVQDPLASDNAFLALLGSKTTRFDAHTKDRSKRRYLLDVDIRNQLSYEEKEPFEFAPEKEPQEDAALWLSAFVDNNRRLKPLDSLEKMIALKRANMERKRILLYRQMQDLLAQKERKASSWGYMMYQWRGSLKYSHISVEIDHLEWDIEKIQQRIEKLEECLTRDDWVKGYETNWRQFEELSSSISYYADLDTAAKVLGWLKKEYEEKEVKPVLMQVEEHKGWWRKRLETLEAQIEEEKKSHNALSESLLDFLLCLAREPICENKPLTTTEVASVLEHLPRRMALVRTGATPEQAENEANVHLVRTLDTPEHVPQEEFIRRMTDIQDRTRKKYCRARLEVEEELRSHAETENKDLAEETTHDETTSPPDDLDLLRFDEEE